MQKQVNLNAADRAASRDLFLGMVSDQFGGDRKKIVQLPPNDELLFVYGTLKKRQHNNAVMREAGGRFVGDATTEESFGMVGFGVPFVFPLVSGGVRDGFNIVGEVWKIPSQAGWRRLDQLESHPFGYIRIKTPVLLTQFGQRESAWLYFNAGPLERAETLTLIDNYSYKY